MKLTFHQIFEYDDEGWSRVIVNNVIITGHICVKSRKRRERHKCGTVASFPYATTFHTLIEPEFYFHMFLKESILASEANSVRQQSNHWSQINSRKCSLILIRSDLSTFVEVQIYIWTIASPLTRSGLPSSPSCVQLDWYTLASRGDLHCHLSHPSRQVPHQQ